MLRALFRPTLFAALMLSACATSAAPLGVTAAHFARDVRSGDQVKCAGKQRKNDRVEVRVRRIFLSRPRPQCPALRRMSCERGGDDGLPARRRITGRKVAATAAKMRDCEVTDDRRAEPRVQELV